MNTLLGLTQRGFDRHLSVGSKLLHSRFILAQSVEPNQTPIWHLAHLKVSKRLKETLAVTLWNQGIRLIHKNDEKFNQRIPDENNSVVTRGIKFKKYEPGMTSAHNYPNKALPKSLCCSVPDGILVYPYTAIPSGDLQSLSRSAAKAISINGVPTCRHWPVQLKDRMLERTTILFIFSGDSTDSDSSAVIRWKHTLDDEGSMPNVQYCFLCAQKSYLWNDWFVRNGMQYMAPRFSSIGNFLGYSGRITFKMINALHLYHRELITVLIIDPLCNIRWHCVGNPTAAAIQSLRDAATCITAENVYSSTRKINITARFQRT